MQIENMEIYANVFGVLGIAANIFWISLKTRKNILAGQVLACFFIVLHYYCLGALTGAAVMAIVGVQALLAIPLEKYPKFRAVYGVSLVLTPVVCFYTWQGPQSIFSSLALGLMCFANFHVNLIRLRAIIIMSIIFWVAHNLMVPSYPGLISNAISLSISIFVLRRELLESKYEISRA